MDRFSFSDFGIVDKDLWTDTASDFGIMDKDLWTDTAFRISELWIRICGPIQLFGFRNCE